MENQELEANKWYQDGAMLYILEPTMNIRTLREDLLTNAFTFRVYPYGKHTDQEAEAIASKIHAALSTPTTIGEAKKTVTGAELVVAMRWLWPVLDQSMAGQMDKWSDEDLLDAHCADWVREKALSMLSAIHLASSPVIEDSQEDRLLAYEKTREWLEEAAEVYMKKQGSRWAGCHPNEVEIDNASQQATIRWTSRDDCGFLFNVPLADLLAPQDTKKGGSQDV